jgi:hypothetical protein
MVLSPPRIIREVELLPEIRDLFSEHPFVAYRSQQREVLKRLARSLRAGFTSRELAYLAGAVEVEANHIRTAEQVGRR